MPTDQLTLDTIWGRFKEFCKPQSNEVYARFDLLPSFRQESRSVDEWYNTVQAQVNLAKYPPETAKILHRDIFLFLLRDEEFVSRTISDRSIDLEIFPASRVKQLAKKLKSSKVTAHHIKQVPGDPQAAQINLLRHQCTELLAGKYKKKRPHVKSKQSHHKPQSSESYHLHKHNTRRGLTLRVHTITRTDVPNVVTQPNLEGFQCPAENIPM